jgi:hypothetical protein
MSDLLRIMMNAFRKRGYNINADWYNIPHILARKVLERELPIVQAIVGTGRESKSERKAFQQGILNATSGWLSANYMDNRTRDGYRNESMSN